MFFGEVNLLIAIMYSIWGMLSIESKIIACSFLGSVELRVVSAKDFFFKSVFFWFIIGVLLRWGIDIMHALYMVGHVDGIVIRNIYIGVFNCVAVVVVIGVLR